jgi:hypothetical protein
MRTLPNTEANLHRATLFVAAGDKPMWYIFCDLTLRLVGLQLQRAVILAANNFRWIESCEIMAHFNKATPLNVAMLVAQCRASALSCVDLITKRYPPPTLPDDVCALEAFVCSTLSPGLMGYRARNRNVSFPQ